MSLDRPRVCIWREQMADSDLTAMTKLVLHTVALYFDSSGRSAYPSLDMIAQRASIDRCTAIRHLKRCADWLDQRKSCGRGNATEYTAIFPERTIFEPSRELACRTASQSPDAANIAPFPGRKRWQQATLSSAKRVAPCTEKGGSAPPHIDQEMERERRELGIHDRQQTFAIDSVGIRLRRFTVPWDSIDGLASACGITVKEARALAEAEGHAWAANDKVPDHPLAYLRTVFAAHRDSNKITAAKIDRVTAAVRKNVQPRQNVSAAPAALSRARQVALVASFLEHREWSARVREVLGPAPGQPGCTIPSQIIEEARRVATERERQACG